MSKPVLSVTVCDGKYTVQQEADGTLHALRYGEEWRDLCGDGMVYALAAEIEELREWTAIEDCPPEQGQHVTAIGQWNGELCGLKETGFMGMGTWEDDRVDMVTDTYGVSIVNVTHWKPAPEYPV